MQAERLELGTQQLSVQLVVASLVSVIAGPFSHNDQAGKLEQEVEV